MVVLLHRRRRVRRVHGSALGRCRLLLVGIELHAWAAVHGRRVCLGLLVRHLRGAAHEERLRSELGVLLLGARVRAAGVGGVVDRVHGGVLGVAVHPLRHLGRLGVEATAMLVVGLRGGYGGGRV